MYWGEGYEKPLDSGVDSQSILSTAGLDASTGAGESAGVGLLGSSKIDGRRGAVALGTVLESGLDPSLVGALGLAEVGAFLAGRKKGRGGKATEKEQRSDTFPLH
jgi:hypothetical protein